mmetsp:Transcript_1351/g.3778  ORF Transcript_1351/g.3778 Transcript_1351/m.3778 type:complete len:266 (-) Transcript_1351:1655-2452(-)
MVAKLSSAKIMSEASLATSVPAMPIAMPMDACFNAGASFTPSPVMAGTSPAALNIFTRACLSFGSVREKTIDPLWLVNNLMRCFSDFLKKSWPVKLLPWISSSSVKMPISRAMASAVGRVSPVIIITRMPAVAHASMAGLTSGRAGSLIPQTPSKIRFLSMLSKFDGSCSFFDAPPLYVSRSLSPVKSSRTAMARTRKGLEAISATVSKIAVLFAAVSFCLLPATLMCVHRSKTFSGAPLTYSLFFAFPQSTDIDFLSLSNSKTA